MKLKSLLKVWNPFYKRTPRKKYKTFSFKSFERELEREKIYKAAYYLEQLTDFLTQYPFNRYGFTDLKWWFIYRLIKKHKYHKLELGLKPGFYELSEIFEKALLSKRVLEQIDELKDYIEKISIQAPQENIDNFKEAYYYLNKSRIWFIQKKLKTVERIDKYILRRKDVNFDYYISRENWIDKLDKKYLKLVIEYRQYLST